jgi:hypothetical protein
MKRLQNGIMRQLVQEYLMTELKREITEDMV